MILSSHGPCRTLLRTLLVPVLIFTTVLGYSQYVVDFEGAGETKGGYASGTVTLTDLDWNLTDALIGTMADDFFNGARSMRLRGYATSSATMLEDKPGGLGSISFNYRRYGTDSQVAWIVEYSTNGGGAWTPIGSPFTATDMVQSFSVTGINAAGNVRIRFRTEATGSSNRRANIDDITITDAVTGCGFTLGAVTAECNGFTGADDTYDLSIEFFGTEAGVTVDYTGTGTVDLSSGDPATDVFGTILVTGISELEDYSVTFSAPCDVLVVAGTAPVCEAPPTLVINEILADPDGTEGDANGDMVVDTSEDEFVEIVNFGATDIDISGWTLSDAGQVRHVFPPATTVAAGCAIVVFGGGTPTGTFGGATVQTASSGLLGLNNTGDDVILENGSGVVASYSYGGEGGNNASLVRDEDITGPEPLVVHSIATGSGGAAQSPGTRIDGTLFGGCPVPACTVVFLTPEVTCESLMSGPGDTYSVSIPYTGSQGGITVVNSSGSGSVSGDDPATTSGGTILITGISDADAYSISLSSPCDEQIVSGAAPACEPPITLVINEVDYDNVGNDDDEWVEIHNYGLDPIDLDGFQLEFGNGASGVLYETILLPAVSLPAGGYFVVGNSATNPGVDFQFGTANLIQNGGSDGMALRGPLGQIVDALSYEGNCGAPYIEGTGFTGADDNSTEGRTIARVPNGTDTNDNASDWIVWCATIGASNDSDDDDDAIANCQDPCPLAVSGITNFDENTCACLLGYYATVEDVNGNNVITACTICPPGTYCADGLVSIPCPVGRFQSLEGQVSCVDCVEGTFNGSLGATSCQPCEPGYFSNVTGASFCQACAAGEFSDQFGSSECQACPAGTYNPNEGMTECLACDSEESSMPGSTECFFDLTCTTDMSLDITLPALGTLPTYELRRSLNDQLIVSGGGGVGNAGITPFTFCLPDGKFYLVLNDMPAGGKYLLRTDGSPNIRFIDDQEPAANNQVTEFTVSPSTLNSRGAVQIPAGPTEFLYTSCDKYFWKKGEFIVVNEDADVAAEWVPGGGTAGQSSTTGYDFWFYDPNGGYSFIRQRRHNVTDGFGNVGSARTCHMQVNNWAAANWIPNQLPLNVRVRAVVNNVPKNWGPACRFVRDDALALCPPTKLMDVPGNPFISCNVFRDFNNQSINRLYARPVAGATQYRFTISNAELGSPIVREVNTYYLTLGWGAGVAPPLNPGEDYDVTVQAFKGGVWCTAGETCKVTINNAVNGGQQNSAMEGQGNAALKLWPNPNRGDLLNVSLLVPEELNTITMDIFDLSGTRVITRTIAAQDGVVNTKVDLDRDLASGMYIVNVTAGDRTWSQRLVIQP